MRSKAGPLCCLRRWGTITLMEDTGASGAQQPGQTVTPSPPADQKKPQPSKLQEQPAAKPAPKVATLPAKPAPEAAPEAAAGPFEQPAAAAPAVDATPAGGFFRPEGNGGADMLDDSPEGSADELAADDRVITWTASEFVAHTKTFGWYAALGAGAAVLAALVYLMTKDWVSVGVILMAALLLGVYGSRQPRQLEYRLDSTGLSVGQKHFGYHSFRSFSVLPEGGISSIVFMPLKRFAVPTTIYYPPDEEDKIVQLLSDRLPLEEGGRDVFDRFLHRIRF